MPDDSRIDKQDVTGFSDEALVGAVLERIWYEKYPSDEDERMPSHLSTVSEGMWKVLGVVWIDREVTNGGFEQYFENPYSYFFDRSLKLFIEADGTHYVDLLRRAASVFPDGVVPVSHRRRRQFTDSLRRQQGIELSEGMCLSPWDSLTSHFYELRDRDDYWQYPAKYIRTHPEEFFR